MAQLIVMDGPGVGTTFELQDNNIIGKSPQCNIRLDSKTLKEKHTIIKKEGESYFIISINNNPVMVNNEILKGKRKLVHGDMISIGEIMLLYGEETEEASKEEEESEKTPTIKSRQKYYKSTEAAIKSIGQSKDPSKNMEVLLKVSNAIMSKLELKELLQQLLDIIFEVLPADRGTIFLRDPKLNKLWPMATKKRKEIQQTSKLMASRTIIREVLETKEGVLTRDAMEDARFQMGLSIAAQQIHAAICVPLVGKNEEVLGVIHIDSVRSDRVFTEDHLRLVTAIAMQSALAIENALLVQQLGEKKRIEQELTIASNIQKELLPKAIPKIQGIEVFGLMIPAKEVGGDYYDFVAPENKKSLYICIGDVSGKGVPAGLVMVMARCFFRPLILTQKNTKAILEELNKLLVDDTRKDMFMSMLVIKWDVMEKKFKWTGAGHEHLLIYRAKTKKCEAIRAGGIVLGMLKKAGKFFKENELYLDIDDSILLYTDGVTECINPKGEMLELPRLKLLVEKYGHLEPKLFCGAVLKELKAFMGKAPQHDDITLVAIKRVE